jgi:TetR/AcrR family transcriptional regulator, repressor for uid operon
VAALTSLTDTRVAAPAQRAQVRPETQERILEAAFACVADYGLARTTMDQVARRAVVSRQTVYRYFPSKDQLVMALVLREEEAFLDGVRAAFAVDDRLERALFDGILFCLRFAREHPLLDRLLATDAETLLPYLTTRSAPLIARAREVMVSLAASKGWVRADLVQQAADTLVRVIISYAVAPPDRDPEDVARDLARILTAALIRRKEPRP